MVIDTSAIVALLRREPEEPSLREALRGDAVRLMGAPTVVECSLVVEGRWGESGRRFLDDLLAGLGIEVVAFDAAAADAAVVAWRRFGKGIHPAALNFGDCITYAVARATGEPILCSGQDFARTDAHLVPLTGG